MESTSTRKVCENAFAFKYNFKLSLVYLLTAFCFLTSFYANAGGANSSNRQGNAPFTGTESLRTNLYLLNVSNNSTILADGVLTEYNNLYHDVVTLEDAYKFTNINENLGISRYTSTLAVERRPIIATTDTIFFKLWKTTQRNYQFEFIATNLFHPGMEAVLQDSYLGTSIPLSLTGTTKVNFFVNSNPASGSATRFKVVYNTPLIASPLPVTFTSIKGAYLQNKVSVEWKVESEINVVKYEVERSVTGKDFSRVNTIYASGVNNSSNNYVAYDEAPEMGNNFYRIKSVDKDGSQKYSPIIKVASGKTATGSITIYPNPIKGNVINLQFTNQLSGLYQVRLINNAGQMISSNKVTINGSNTLQSISTNKELKGGLYQVEIIKPDNTVEIQKAIVQQ